MMPRDKAVEAGNGFSNAAPVAGDDCAEVFGIEPRGQRSRSDQVTKQYRKLPALDRARVRCRRYHRGRIHAQFGPAIAAELVCGEVCRAAGRTAPHDCRSALATEFLLLRDFGCAIRALHPDLNGGDYGHVPALEAQKTKNGSRKLKQSRQTHLSEESLWTSSRDLVFPPEVAPPAFAVQDKLSQGTLLRV